MKDRVALVTGASSGIGEATARALARSGAKVALAARRIERLEALAASITQEGGEALPLRADVSREGDIRAALDQIATKWSRLDIVVNNAGVMLLAPVAESSFDDWRKMVELNLLGAMMVTKLALPFFQRAGGGHIVNVASVAGRVANPSAGAYAATKFGLVAFSESVRREVYKDKVRVTVIEPGIVETELADHITHAGMKASLTERVAALEPLQSDDIANAVLYAVTQPARVNVNEILIRPTGQER